MPAVLAAAAAVAAVPGLAVPSRIAVMTGVAVIARPPLLLLLQKNGTFCRHQLTDAVEMQFPFDKSVLYKSPGRLLPPER